MARKTQVLRSAAVASLGAALVIAGVELGDPQAPQAETASPRSYWAEGEMPDSPGAMEYPLGDSMSVNGVPIRMTYFQLKMDPDAVRDHYVRALADRGLVPQVEQGAGGGWTVSSFAESGNEEIVIAILGQGPRKLLVFPSIVPLGATNRDEAQKYLDDLPLSPAATGALTVTSSDKPGEAMITYQEPQQPAGSTATFIRDDMGKRGWELLEFNGPTDKQSAWTVEGRHGGRRARFTITPWPRGESGATVAVQLSRAE